MDLISFKTHHLNRRHFYDEIQLLLFSVFPCWKVWDHRKSGHWQISALFRFQIHAKYDANLVKGIYCFIQKIFARADYGLKKFSKTFRFGWIFVWKRSLWSPKPNLPSGCSTRIPERSHGWFAKKFLWFNILSHLWSTIGLFMVHSTLHGTSRNNTHLILLTRYNKRQDLKCQKSFHPFLSKFGLNWSFDHRILVQY